MVESLSQRKVKRRMLTFVWGGYCRKKPEKRNSSFFVDV